MKNMQNSKRKKIISIDLDGTLLRDNNDISKKTFKVLQKLSNMNNIIVVSTGRSLIGIPKSIRDINFIDYYITSNGTTCINKNNNIIIRNWFDYEDIKDITDDKHFLIEYLIYGKWYIDNTLNLSKIIKDQEILEYIKKTRTLVNRDFFNLNHIIEKINVNFMEDDFNYAFNKINTFIKDKNLRCWSDKKHKLDIYSKSANKGNTLKDLSNLLKIDSNNIIAFGNDENDIEMLKYAQNSVAMINSSGNLKKVAKFVTTESNNNDGVSIFLNNYFDLNIY